MTTQRVGAGDNTWVGAPSWCVAAAMYQPSVLDQPSNFTLKERNGLRYRTMTFVRSSSLLSLLQRWNKRKNYLSFNDLSKRDRAARVIQKRWRASCV